MYWLFCVVLFFTFSSSETKLLEELLKTKWLCANENCTEPISDGHSVRSYSLRDDLLKVVFNVNDKILIFAKPNEPLNYWLVQAGNQKGIASVNFIKEDHIFVNKLNLIEIVFSTDFISIPSTEKPTAAKETIKPTQTKLIIDGTTISDFAEDVSEEEILADDGSGETIDNQRGPVVKPHKSYIVPSKHGIKPLKTITGDDSGSFNESKISQKTSRAETDVAIDGNNTNVSQETNNHEVSTADQNNLEAPSNHSIENLSDSQVSTNEKEIETSTPVVKTETYPPSPYHAAPVVSNPSPKIENTFVKENDFSTTLSPISKSPSNHSIDDLSDSQVSTNEKEIETSTPVVKIETYPPSPYHAAPVVSNPSPKIENTFVKEGDFSSTLSSISKSPSHHSIENLSDSQVSTNEKETETSTPVLLTEANSPSPYSAVPVISNSSFTTENILVQEGAFPTISSPISGNDTNVNINSETVSMSEFVESPNVVALNNEAKENILETPSPPTLDSEAVMATPSVFMGSTSELADSKKEFTFQQTNQNLIPESNLNDKNSFNENHIFYSENNVDKTQSIENKASIDGDNGFGGHELSVDMLPKTTVEPPPQHLHEPEIISFEQTITVQNEYVPEVLVAENTVKEEQNDDKISDTSFANNDYSEPVDKEGDNWFSGFSSVMDSIKEMFAKSDIGVDDKVVSFHPIEELESASEKSSVFEYPVDKGLYCDKDPFCSSDKEYSQLSDESEDKGNSVLSEMLEGFPEPRMSFPTISILVITSIVVLLFSLGHYYLENLKHDSALITKINTISAELFFAQKELASIEEEYKLANDNYQKLVSETSNNEMAIEKMRKELEESNVAKSALEEEIKRLEKEIESLIEEGDEMHRMLAESFSEEERTKSLLGNIADLKNVLSERLQEIVSLTEQLDKEKQEVELLTISLKKSEERRENTEDRLAKVLNDADTNTLTVTKEFEEKITTLERIIEERSLERTNFEKQICELNGTCETLMVEKELIEKQLRKAHGVSSGKALNDWLETKQIRADFLVLQKEVEKLNKALDESKQRSVLLEEKEKTLLNEIEILNNKYEAVEKDKIEALTKLQVLSNYFKEKEIQLQEELGTKEAQWLQKQSEDHTIYEQMRSLREENFSYKAQNEALKKEILDQEASFKIQIANEEQKAQENWINLRHTERRLKEVQMEASHLRSRLTAIEANPDSLDEKHKSLEMVNGDVSMGAASPPFMLYPPPDFIPPPPLVSPTRPPPLGRLSSPPMTPPAPLSPFEFYPPPPPSPPLPLRVHKPQPREPHRKQKDSQSSNQSSESTEKSLRRGKR